MPINNSFCRPVMSVTDESLRIFNWNTGETLITVPFERIGEKREASASALILRLMDREWAFIDDFLYRLAKRIHTYNRDAKIDWEATFQLYELLKMARLGDEHDDDDPAYQPVFGASALRDANDQATRNLKLYKLPLKRKSPKRSEPK